MELLSASEFIAARLDAIREGNTVEFVLDGESLVRIHVYGPERGTFNAWRGRAASGRRTRAPSSRVIPSRARFASWKLAAFNNVWMRCVALRPVARDDRLGAGKSAERDREAMTPSSPVRKRHLLLPRRFGSRCRIQGRRRQRSASHACYDC